MSLGLFNCRLIQPARDQLFFFAGCLAAPVPVRASSVQSPCDASCSAPTSGRVRNASCVFPSQEGFVLVFRGSEAPVGCRRVHPTDSPTNSPEDPPILPIDSAIEPKKARELFGEIAPPQIPRVSCEDTLVYDVSIFYATVGEVAARAFSAKEVAQDEPFHLLQRYAADVTSPVQVAPVARMLAGASLKPAQLEALLASFAGALGQLSGDDRSFSATISGDADAALAGLPAACARHGVNVEPLLGAWQAYQARQLGGTRCADSAALAPLPIGQCDSPQCQQLAAQFTKLVIAPNGYGLTPEQKATSEWGGKLLQYLAALADWTEDDDPDEYFDFKSRFYTELFHQTPSGPQRDLLLSTLLGWLQQSGYQHNHRAEWFYPVNALIIRTFADPAGMQATMRDLRRSSDPVIALYAQLEQLLPRPIQGTLGLL